MAPKTASERQAAPGREVHDDLAAALCLGEVVGASDIVEDDDVLDGHAQRPLATRYSGLARSTERAAVRTAV